GTAEGAAAASVVARRDGAVGLQGAHPGEPAGHRCGDAGTGRILRPRTRVDHGRRPREHRRGQLARPVRRTGAQGAPREHRLTTADYDRADYDRTAPECPPSPGRCGHRLRLSGNGSCEASAGCGHARLRWGSCVWLGLLTRKVSPSSRWTETATATTRWSRRSPTIRSVRRTTPEGSGRCRTSGCWPPFCRPRSSPSAATTPTTPA